MEHYQIQRGNGWRVTITPKCPIVTKNNDLSEYRVSEVRNQDKRAGETAQEDEFEANIRNGEGGE